MTADFWHNMSIRIARALPPLARLHDHRNSLLHRVEALQDELAAKPVSLQAELQQLRDQLIYVVERRAEGYFVEFDYPYSPRVRHWDQLPGGNLFYQLIASGADRYAALLTSFLAYRHAFTAIPRDELGDEREPYWSNSWLPTLDGICLSGMIAKLNPRRYVEIGSGNSTRFARRAISDHGLRTSVISIDPEPREAIDSLCDKVIRQKLEDCDLAIFADLGPEDVLFIDNSHRCFQGSDVAVFFTEVLPRLGSGCHYGIHDIFLPYDYPQEWLSRFYNEQYLLMMYLLGGAAGDEIVLPVYFVQTTPELVAILDPIVRHPRLSGLWPGGGAFWMRKA